MNSYSARKKPRILPFFTVILVFLMAVGCQPSGQKQEQEKENIGFLKDEALTSFEELYGQDGSAVLDALKLDAEDMEEGPNPGLWNRKEPVLLQDENFTESLLMDVNSNTLYGERFTCALQDAERAAKLLEKLLDEARAAYGEPTTYPGLSNRLTSETFSDDFAKAMADGSQGDWREDWSLSESTDCTLSVKVTGRNSAEIILEYALIAER